MPVRTRSQHTIWNGLIDLFPFFYQYFTPRDLLQFVLVHRDFVALATYQVVVDVAYISGNENINRTLQYLIELTRPGCIHLPSPRRLLRLICLKRCERCNNEKLNNLPRGYGLALCFRCILDITDQFSPPQHRHHRHDIEWHDIIVHPRVLVKHIRSNDERWQCTDQICMLRETFHASGGRPEGPLITRTSGQMFVESFHEFSEIDQFISHDLQAPPLAAYNELNNFIAKSRSSFYTLVYNRREGRIKGRALHRIRKYQAVKTFLAKLGSMVRYPRMRMILKYRRADHRYFRLNCSTPLSRGYRCLIFANTYVQRTLDSPLKAPIKTMQSHTKMSELARALDAYVGRDVHYPDHRFEKFTMVYQEEWDFFHDIVNDADNIDYGFMDSPRTRNAMHDPLRVRE